MVEQFNSDCDLHENSTILSDLHELTAGRKKIRTSPLENTLFKSVGNALEDLAAAELLEETVLALDRKPTDATAEVSS